ncbi:hypothetical protein [Mycobacterium intracellulare]|uniref:Uncharacterized protein n=1 Tax=Mycobacterium intracellulare subsp. chimaera TaxID=222805 RepID=A0A7U5MRK6_MYCIT|nr:hypothetical protein [Mycobacterium intracellulare]ASL18390.1 hypothetical protein MYCOZU2_06045 [Mycobacterium intracellulare subsp. chimaera]
MDVLIDHAAANATVSQIDEHREARYHLWQQLLREFEDLKASGAMLGQASEACQLAVMRVNDEVERQNQSEIQLIEHIRSALADDLHNEAESAALFVPHGQ